VDSTKEFSDDCSVVFHFREYGTSTREFSNERSVVFERKEYGISTREFSDEGSVMLGRKEYYTFGTESLYTRNRFCEEFSGYFPIGRHSLTHHLRRIGV